MEQFITWYCSDPRLALNRTVVLRFRQYLESLSLAAGTIYQRLAAVRRLAYEAADSGLLSPELAAGIRRVKGVKRLLDAANRSMRSHNPSLSIRTFSCLSTAEKAKTGDEDSGSAWLFSAIVVGSQTLFVE
jgi:hypothetical protein